MLSKNDFRGALASDSLDTLAGNFILQRNYELTQDKKTKAFKWVAKPPEEKLFPDRSALHHGIAKDTATDSMDSASLEKQMMEKQTDTAKQPSKQAPPVLTERVGKLLGAVIRAASDWEQSRMVKVKLPTAILNNTRSTCIAFSITTDAELYHGSFSNDLTVLIKGMDTWQPPSMHLFIHSIQLLPCLLIEMHSFRELQEADFV